MRCVSLQSTSQDDFGTQEIFTSILMIRLEKQGTPRDPKRKEAGETFSLELYWMRSIGEGTPKIAELALCPVYPIGSHSCKTPNKFSILQVFSGLLSSKLQRGHTLHVFPGSLFKARSEGLSYPCRKLRTQDSGFRNVPLRASSTTAILQQRQRKTTVFQV